VTPVGGGQVIGSGRLWVSPEAEFDERAVRMQYRGTDLPVSSLLHRYLPEVSRGRNPINGCQTGTELFCSAPLPARGQPQLPCCRRMRSDYVCVCVVCVCGGGGILLE
jgi:hypothetical protein